MQNSKYGSLVPAMSSLLSAAVRDVRYYLHMSGTATRPKFSGEAISLITLRHCNTKPSSSCYWNVTLPTAFPFRAFCSCDS
jgi:hypothetical protein